MKGVVYSFRHEKEQRHPSWVVLPCNTETAQKIAFAKKLRCTDNELTCNCGFSAVQYED